MWIGGCSMLGVAGSYPPSYTQVGRISGRDNSVAWIVDDNVFLFGYYSDY